MLAINDPKLVRRAEIIWEKGTNRADYFRGEVKKYEWVDVGSSFLPSGITAAFLWAQLQALRKIQDKRARLWDAYFMGLKPLSDRGYFDVPHLPLYSTNNAHMFYVVCRSSGERDDLQAHLASNGVQTATHYQSLHDSAYYRDKYRGPDLVNCKHFVECLLRLPLFYELQLGQVRTIVASIKAYYTSRR